MSLSSKVEPIGDYSLPARQSTSKSRGNTYLHSLYREHAGNIRKYLQRNYGSGPPEPEDVVQDVFTKFGESLEAGTEVHSALIENPKAYLYKMAVNHTLNAIGRVKRINQFMAEQMSTDDEGLDELGPENIWARRDELGAVGKAMQLLSEKQRQILVRSRIKGETYAQIAQALDCSIADVSRQLVAALAILHQASQQDDHTNGAQHGR
ncbi:hypothetical protein GCM10009092_29670 [Bowmanella denitrificans]|uniref:RNA polymerase sigma factor 70 region 4 type 2 domain-containing protein n=1 Tax=Bowmanella denitrificans TaxID=366582 RepID=A0ABN0XGT0_9ALTE